MNYGIAFAPLVPVLVLWIALAAVAVIAALLLIGRSRGALIRVAALALIVFALANPSFTSEERKPLSSVAAVWWTRAEPGFRRTRARKPRRRDRRWSIA